MNKPKQNVQTPAMGPGREVMQRVYVVFVFIFAFAMAIIARAVYIQIFKGNELKNIALEREFEFFDTEAVRGNIYSSDGNLLATSIPVYEIRFDADPKLIDQKVFDDSVVYLAKGLSKIFGDKSYTEYQQLLVNSRINTKHFIKIQSNVTYDKLRLLRKLPIFCRGQFKGGLIALMKPKRVYPYDDLARRTIGFSRPSDSIFVGLEGYYNSYLEGKKGNELRQRMANAAWKPVYSELNYEPQDGKDIVTTIDSYLQDVAESTLQKHLIYHKADQGTVVLMEVNTGEIKAIANLQLDKKGGKYKEIYNMAVGWAFEPGSTFKLPSMMVAMEDGVMDRTKQVYTGNGSIKYGFLNITDVHQIGTSGWSTPLEIFAESSNVGVSKIIYDNYKSDPKSFINGLIEMHLTDSLGIDIPGEVHPEIGEPGGPGWSIGSLPSKSIGYELTITPLHLLTFYNAVANDGVMVRPKFVKEIREAGKTIQKFETESIASSICSNKTIALAQQYLEAVVEHGTAHEIWDSAYKIAGKTGTARIVENGDYVSKYNASFIGYFPADKPKYSCIVVINKPNGGQYYASKVAAPAFKEIANVVYAMELDIHPQQNSAFVNNLQASLPLLLKDTLLVKFGLNPDGVLLSNVIYSQIQTINDSIVLPKIPDVTGLGARNAVFLLESLGLKTEIIGRGYVVDQSIKAGTTYRAGEQVKLTLDFNTTTL